jgi:hypothetical protein
MHIFENWKKNVKLYWSVTVLLLHPKLPRYGFGGYPFSASSFL